MLSVPLLKRGLIAFWALWFTVVMVANVCDGLKWLAWINQDFPFASGGYLAIVKTTSVYRVSTTADAVMFAGAILLQATAAFFLARAALHFARDAPHARRELLTGFGAALLLFAGFMLADEFFHSYVQEQTHLQLFVALLVTLLTLQLLPE